MANFAEINDDGIVIRVLVVADDKAADGENFLANELGFGGTWVETFEDGTRGVFAGVGFTYDKNKDVFIQTYENSVNQVPEHVRKLLKGESV
jgi:hypothetical protein